jgi:hypothetical protein
METNGGIVKIMQKSKMQIVIMRIKEIIIFNYMNEIKEKIETLKSIVKLYRSLKQVEKELLLFQTLFICSLGVITALIVVINHLIEKIL